METKTIALAALAVLVVATAIVLTQTNPPIIAPTKNECGFGVCPDGSTYEKYSWNGNQCVQLQYFADPCGKPTPNPTPPPIIQNGIQGMVLLGPICPVERNPPDPNCSDHPYSANIIVKNSSMQEVTRFSSDDNGWFKVELSPGNYLLEPQPTSSVYPKPVESISVVVSSGTFTDINLYYDTGIR